MVGDGKRNDGEGELMKELRVLVVDDSPVDRRIVELLLKKSGGGSFHVIAVDSGKKAMELLGLNEEKLESSATDEQKIDVVLTDYCMPEMTGYELLKVIKEQSSPQPIPVIVMSSENEPQRISRCLTAGAEDFIVKPLQTKDLQRLKNCSSSKPREPQSKISVKTSPPPPSDSITEQSRSKRTQFTGIAMVLNNSSVEFSNYFPFLFKFILLVYAFLCLSELFNRWSTSWLPLWCA